MSLRKTVSAALALAAVIAVASTATAQENGSVQWVGSFLHGYVTIEHGEETYTGGPLKGTMTIVDSSGGPFVIGVNSVAECLVSSRNRPDGLLLEAPCAFTDTAGDVLYTYALRQEGTLGVGGGGEGTWELRGGTGTYARIEGSCSYQTEYLQGDRVVVISDCTWSRS